MSAVEVPDVVAATARRAGHGAWVDGLPDLVEELAGRWGLVPGAPFGDGTEALVLAATTAAGQPVVLKLLVPRVEMVAREVAVLDLAGGDGCARLHRSDVARGALLLERLGPSLRDLGWPLARRLEVLVEVARRVWRPVPDHVDLPDGAAKAQALRQAVLSQWEELDRPCSGAAVDHAVACAERRGAAHDDERAVLVHGDVHQWNALRSGDGFKLVDPDGLRAEAECDLGVLMREDPVELVAGDPWDRARWLARRTGLDATAVWEWGVAERVSTGLLATAVGLQPEGRRMLAAADRIAVRHRDG